MKSNSSAVVCLLAAAAVLASPQTVFAQNGPRSTNAGKGGRPTVDLKVCNRSGRKASVAVSYIPVGETTFMNKGWFTVEVGACRILAVTDNANFYFYADALDGSNRSWQGNHDLCVAYPGPYSFYSDDEEECGSDQSLRAFVAVHTDQPGVYTWNMDP